MPCPYASLLGMGIRWKVRKIKQPQLLSDLILPTKKRTVHQVGGLATPGQVKLLSTRLRAAFANSVRQ